MDDSLIAVGQNRKGQISALTQRLVGCDILRRYRPKIGACGHYLFVHRSQLNQLALAPGSPIAPVEDDDQRLFLQAGRQCIRIAIRIQKTEVGRRATDFKGPLFLLTQSCIPKYLFA